MAEHLSRESLEAYVIGALDEAECARVESHVLACAACERRLQREASLELAFTQVARADERPRRVARLAAPAVAVSGVLAVAAAMILWLGARPDDVRAPAAEAPMADTAADASTATARLDVVGDGAVRSAMRD